MALVTWDQVKDYPTIKNWLASGDLAIHEPGLTSSAPDDALDEPPLAHPDDKPTEPLLCDLNTASHDQLTQLKGMGDATASKLIELRTVRLPVLRMLETGQRVL